MHSSVLPFTEQLAEQFTGRACTGMMDLFIGYDKYADVPTQRWPCQKHTNKHDRNAKTSANVDRTL
jgi:hypothetical protein